MGFMPFWQPSTLCSDAVSFHSCIVVSWTINLLSLIIIIIIQGHGSDDSSRETFFGKHEHYTLRRSVTSDLRRLRRTLIYLGLLTHLLTVWSRTAREFQ